MVDNRADLFRELVTQVVEELRSQIRWQGKPEISNHRKPQSSLGLEGQKEEVVIQEPSSLRYPVEVRNIVGLSGGN